ERKVCRHQALVAHFDEVIESCSTSCDACTGETLESRLAGMVDLASADFGEDAPVRVRSAARSSKGSRTSQSLDVDALDDDERELFDALRALRRTLADEARVPAYIVFGDRVLLEMVARRPRTYGELLQVPGVGQAKLERYGDAFLEAIRATR
ncbi:MAG: HRDC domain-containing protein, partial [Gemmatimonadaceae bacterium]